MQAEPLNLSFEVTEDDVWQFQKYHLKHAPSSKKMFRILWTVAALFTASNSFIRSLSDGALIALTTAIISTAVVLLGGMAGFKLFLPLMRFATKSQSKDATGKMTLELVPDGLRERSRVGEMMVYWDSIGEIITTPTVTFVYRGTSGAIIIPHRRITGGNYAAFMQAFADVYARQRDAALRTAAPAPVAVPGPVIGTAGKPTETEQTILENRNATGR